MATKAKATDVEVGIMIVQPTRNGIEEIAHNKIKVPYLKKERANKTKQARATRTEIPKVEKPKIKKAVKQTKDKSGRVEE